MKAWCVGQQTGLDGLALMDLPEPVAGPGEIIVRVTAAGLNYRDLMLLRGQYGAPQPPERVMVSDGVGVVTALGEGVTGLAVGDRVIAPNFTGWLDQPFGMALFGADLGVTTNGWLAEQIKLPAVAAIRVPESMPDETAATFAIVGATVWHAMVAFGQVQPGELVLAQGTGGVAIFALQLAKALGARFAITSSSDTKLQKCRELGADFTVNYKTNPDWVAALMAETGGQGADVIVDTLGFSAFAQTIAAAAVNGRIGTLGALSSTPQAAAAGSQGLIIAKNLTTKGIASGSRNMLAQAIDVIAKSGSQMLIDREFAFAEAPAALAHLESGAHMGKIVVRVRASRFICESGVML